MVEIVRYIKTALLAAALILNASGGYCAELLKELNLHGFTEAALGLRFKSDTTKHDSYDLAEQRVQIRSAYFPENRQLEELSTELSFKGDFTVDEYYAGKTNFETREANVFLSPVRWADLKIGRQIFTWGTGDYLFINDIFPKDYISFYAGREDEYLKKPSDGAKASLYSRYANLDIVVIPFFEPDTMPKGDRLSFLDTFRGGIAGTESDRHLIEAPYQFDNTETALRLYRSIRSYELAGYFFRGFYKAPLGYKNEALRQLFYPRLDVYGASARGPVFSGIGNIEFGYYNSRQDRKGTNRLIENSSIKLLIGYEKDMGNDLRIGIQYQHQQTLDYDEYIAALLPADFYWDESRELITMRVTRLLLKQTMKLSLFTFFSPSDMDVYTRPLIEYDISDHLKAVFGANLVWGQDDQTELGQMERNSNIYTRIRYTF